MESQNPYLKVINIETVFPNKLILHCAEREELFCIKGRDDLYYICDEELKILDVRESFENGKENPIFLNIFEKELNLSLPVILSVKFKVKESIINGKINLLIISVKHFCLFLKNIKI